METEFLALMKSECPGHILLSSQSGRHVLTFVSGSTYIILSAKVCTLKAFLHLKVYELYKV